ncbi:MAG TPA: SpoIIE family protein phosphatase [Sedimentibacter sp.]|nr:SpoIIE family protein phosphatase [Sedimentibacter sp.]
MTNVINYLFYTDGLVEVKNLNGSSIYNQEDLKDFLIKNYSMKASLLYSSIKDNLYNKIGKDTIMDDVTFLIMEIY